MQLPSGLLDKFFKGQCTEAEKQRVQAYFSEHPEALDSYFNEQAWLSFEPEQLVPEVESRRMLDNIERRAGIRKPLRLPVFRSVAAAASVLLVAAAFWYFSASRNVAPQMASTTHSGKSDPAAQQAFRINTTGSTIHLALADGSVVELAPASEIRYSQDFPRGNRNIILNGTALFRVAKFPGKPFTVYAGDIATTALGTVFKVTQGAKGLFSVDLLEGRVVVQPGNELAIHGIKDTYLSAGQRLTLDLASNEVSVKTRHAVAAAKKVAQKQVLEFDNKPLSEIFHTLETAYHLKFVFTSRSLNEMNFTGVFDENKETVADFVQTICLLNDLGMQQQNDTIGIVPNSKQ